MRGSFLTLLGSVFLTALSCSVYDEALKICVEPQCQKANGGKSGGGGDTTGGEGGVAAGGGGGAAAGTAYCGAPAPVTYPDPPTSATPGTKNVEIVAAQYTIDLGDAPKAAVEPTHYLDIGFDLDNKCTTTDTLKTSTTCAFPPYAVGVVDGKGGIDNALGRLIQGVRDAVKDFSSDNYSKDLQQGKSNVLLRLENWNGEANDSEVRVSTMVAAPFDSFSTGALPAWDGMDPWPVASDSLNSNSVDDPKFVDIHAYVSNYQVVASLSEANLRLDVGLSSVRRVKLDMKLTAAFVVCTIVPVESGKWGWTFSRCTLGGRWLADDLVKQLGQFPNPVANNAALCRGNQTYESFKELICGQVDMLHTTGSPTLECDALSMGVTYAMKPALLGNIFTLAPVKDPCCIPPPTGDCTPESPDDYIRNPKYDCCASILGPDGGLLGCGTAPNTGGTGNGGAGGAGTGGRGTGGRATGGAGGAAAGGGGGAGGAGGAKDAGAGGRDASTD